MASFWRRVWAAFTDSTPAFTRGSEKSPEWWREKAGDVRHWQCVKWFTTDKPIPDEAKRRLMLNGQLRKSERGYSWEVGTDARSVSYAMMQSSRRLYEVLDAAGVGYEVYESSTMQVPKP